MDNKARAEQLGIQPHWQDVFGKNHDVPDATLAFLVSALGSGDDAPSTLPPVKALTAGRPYRLPAGNARRWELIDESGNRQSGNIAHQEITLPSLAAGYYTLRTALPRDHAEETFLIVAPERCWQPDGASRIWGLAAQLYGLRSANNFGIGDFSDVAALAQCAAKLGANALGLSPLHALFPSDPTQFSPYSPSNRLFLAMHYIDVTAAPGFGQCAEAQALLASAEYQEKLAQACSAELVDYAQVYYLKSTLLETFFAWFQRHGDQRSFEEFRGAQDDNLRKQAIFDALCEHYKAPWPQWPESYQDANSREVSLFAAAHQPRVDYYEWLQWLAETQLQSAQRSAKAAGMALGLYRDLAVGSNKSGAEVWIDPMRFISGVSVGAPPDEYNPMGQNWGLPPLNPFTLRQTRYRGFIELLRANMRNAGALRIDHAFGLSRLFLIPDGCGAEEGAYLHYPLDEMLAVLKLESHRHRCLIIGEDLGTFPPNYKEAAAESGLLSYRVFYFERDSIGDFLPPARYPTQALATLSTHDLPTLDGWWQGADLAERAKLKLYPNADLQQRDQENRKKDRPRLQAVLQRQQLAQGDASVQQLTDGVQRYLAQSPAMLVMVQLEDIIGVTIQANLPGTTDERPNWCMRLPMALEALAADAHLAQLGESMQAARKKPARVFPRATYRLQFHKDFTFRHAAAIIPYLAELGISHVYASPYLKARPGSTHGYDITDHNAFNPELGGEDGYGIFLDALRGYGIKQILDFVPNHTGVGADNRWWQSVLEWGEDSLYADYFDIDWQAGERRKLLLPVLGKHYGDALESGELSLVFDQQTGGFFVQYFDNRYPICPGDYHAIDTHIRAAHDEEDGTRLKAELVAAKDRYAFISAQLHAINQDRQAVHAIIDRQHYRLAFWRMAGDEINYRRFFDINDLAGMRVEQEAVFDAMHKLTLSLIDKGELDGLRIDHIDGLAEPAQYCQRLREKLGGGLYLTVEKILGAEEPLRRNWPIDGTSGYDALNQISAVFVATENQQAIEQTYRDFTGVSEPFADLLYQAKCELLRKSFGGEWQALALKLAHIARQNIESRDYTAATLKTALQQFIACFPAYRAYVTPSRCDADDRQLIDDALLSVKTRGALPDGEIYEFIARLLKLEIGNADETVYAFVRKFQQLSGPVMAKGLEDTSFYRYYPLASLNEVGGDPSRFGIGVAQFHAINQARASLWPHSMIATATHDTKRGEDMRLRIHVLSEMPEQWASWLAEWSAINQPLRSDKASPSRGDEYFIYQTLLGSWPVELLQNANDSAALTHYAERLDAYLTKAMREGKQHSNWLDPNKDYEEKTLAFLHQLLNPENAFLALFQPAARLVANRAVASSLGQLALKLTLPGGPDIYQGTERWDLSLVDPDNRRPVDYALRQTALTNATPLADALANWHSGLVKQQLLYTLLMHRKREPDLYAYGSYEPLAVAGTSPVVAFCRRYENRLLIVVIATRTATPDGGNTIPGQGIWQDMRVTLPQIGSYRNIVTAEQLEVNDTDLSIGQLLKDFPVAILEVKINTIT